MVFLVFGLRWRSARGLWVIPKGLSATSYRTETHKKLAQTSLDSCNCPLFTPDWKRKSIFFTINHFLGKISLKVCHFASWCLNILNHDLRCKFRAQTHIDAVQLPIMNHLSFYKTHKHPKNTNSTSTTSMNSTKFLIRFWS